MTTSLPSYFYLCFQVIITERFDEGLLLLRQMLRWELIDLTYVVVNETKDSNKANNGKSFVNPPDFDDLPRKARRTPLYSSRCCFEFSWRTVPREGGTVLFRMLRPIWSCRVRFCGNGNVWLGRPHARGYGWWGVVWIRQTRHAI